MIKLKTPEQLQASMVELINENLRLKRELAKYKPNALAVRDRRDKYILAVLNGKTGLTIKEIIKLADDVLAEADQ